MVPIIVDSWLNVQDCILFSPCWDQRIAQDYDKVHPARGTETTKFVKIWEEMEKIGVPCKTGEPYHHKIQEKNDLNYGKSYGSESDKILI